MKKDVTVVKEYVRGLSDEDLNLIIERLTQPISGDRADVSLIFERNKEINKWLCNCKNAEDWFNKVDMIQDSAELELSKRTKKDG